MKPKDNRWDENTNHGICCRIGGDGDVASLCKLTHECFPASFKWHPALDYAEQWWKNALNHSQVKVVVAEDRIGIVGFSVVVLDEVEWEAAIKPIKTKLRWGTELLALPVAVLRKIQKVFAGGVNLQIDEGAKTLSHAERAFVALGGVSRRVRRKGVGSRLVNAGIEIAKADNFQGVQRRVNRSNISNLTLLRKLGHQVTAKDKKQYTLVFRF